VTRHNVYAPNKIANDHLQSYATSNLNIFQGAPSYSSCNSPIRYEIRKGLLAGKYVGRVVVFLRGTGCEWMKTGGGCTMCGFHLATNAGVKINDEAQFEQVEKALNETRKYHYPILCLYNDGSFLNPNEISREVAAKILNLINKSTWIKKTGSMTI